jgi:EAL and modified HD-GYP domain-containing signal transduction protein
MKYPILQEEKTMFLSWFHSWFSRGNATKKPEENPQVRAAKVAALDREAPRKEVVQQAVSNTLLCREAVLDREQKIAGYRFLLQAKSIKQVRHNHNRAFLHLCAEILIDALARAKVSELLSGRRCFVSLPDTFLASERIARLPAENTCLCLIPVADVRPRPQWLAAQIARLRDQGYQVGVPNPIQHPEYRTLLGAVDLVYFQTPRANVAQMMMLFTDLAAAAPQAEVLALGLPGMEDFRFYYNQGVNLFQGQFVTSREPWEAKNLGVDMTRLTLILKKLRSEADNAEIAALIKQDVALTVRLLRYINSAASGLRNPIASIEKALLLLGRANLMRWLLLCSADSGQPRAAAVFETALVRARTMELFAATKPPEMRDALFLTGLLSLVDVILQQPLAHVLSSMPLDPEIIEAILQNTGPYAPALELAQACEIQDPSFLVAAAERCEVAPEQVVQWHMEALVWMLALQEMEQRATAQSA